MIPILYPENLIDGKVLGRGKLVDVISCKIYEEINGDYSMTMEYPINGVLFSELCNGGTVQVIGPVFPNPSQGEGGKNTIGEVWFDIYKHSLPIGGVVTFYGLHVSRRLAKMVFYGTELDPVGDNGPFKVYYTQATPRVPGFTTPPIYNLRTPSLAPTPTEGKSSLAALIGDEGSFVSEFGGEFAFRTGYNALHQPAMSIFWVDKRGADNGVSIRYGVNMTDIEHTIDRMEVFNAVVPFWEESTGNRYYISSGDKYVQPTTPITPVKATLLDCSEWFPTKPTDTQLRDAARNWLDTYQPWIPDETIEIDSINGALLDEHSPDISLGDTIHVYWGDADISAELRAVAYTYDVLAQKYTDFQLGKQTKNYVAVTGDTLSGPTVSASSEMKTFLYSGTFAAVGQTPTVPILTRPVRYACLLGLIYQNTSGMWFDIAQFGAFFSTDPFVQFDNSGVALRYGLGGTSGSIAAARPLKAIIGYIE